MNKELELYDFTLENIGMFSGKRGIYGLVYDDEIIYVGQSKNIGNRLKTHRKANTKSIIDHIIREEGKCNRCKQLALYYFIDENREEMNFVILEETEDLNEREKYYISLFKPKYNYKGVDVPYEI